MTCIALSLCITSIISVGCTHASIGNTLESEKPGDSNHATTTAVEPNTTLPNGCETVFPPKVSLILEKDTYSVEDGVISGVLKNDTDMTFLLPIFSVLLEKWTDGRWNRMDIIQDTIPVHPMQFYLSPHSQRYWGFSAKYLYGHLETGSYRVSTTLKDPSPEFAISATIIPSNLGDLRVYAEFKVA